MSSQSTDPRSSIEVSTLIIRSPAENSPDDDPTGVRDLLSSLPQPAPMPDYLVERINASLAAEQAQRGATPFAASIAPLVAPARRRPGRLLGAVAGAAAAVALFVVVGTSLFQTSRPTTVSGSASTATSTDSAARGQTLTSKQNQPTGESLAAPAASPPLVMIRLSGTRYTQASFVTQARDLGDAAIDQIQRSDAARADVGPVGTTPGLLGCLNAIGAGAAQIVRADLALYEGRPAVIILATTNGATTAYAVGRQCSSADAAVLRPATPLP